MADTEIFRNILTSTVVLAAAGFIINQIWKGYKDFQKDVYDKVGKKVDKTDCKDFRDAEERRMKEHREEGHARK